jgi:exodeoxyribonuclease VII small subunit
VSAKKKKVAAAGKPAGDDLSFEDALLRLEELVERLEEGKVPLEESLAAFAEGTRLVKLCQERLERAELTIKELSESGGGFRLSGSPLQDEVDGEEEGEGDEENEQNELEF